MPLHIDFETRSVADLREVGLYNYAQHPTTAPWCLAYAFDEAEPLLWLPGDPCPTAIRQHVESGGLVIAHNVQFEFAIWNSIMVPRFGWPELKLDQVDCTMARAYAMGLPGALEDAALTLGLSVLKDTEGRALMLRLARPRSAPGETPVVWWDDPNKLARLYEYCKQDVRVEQQLHKRLLPLSERERAVWRLDQKINLRGVQVDVITASAASHMAETVRGLYDRQIETLTDGQVKSCNAVAALKQWIAAQGVEVESLARQAIIDMEAAVGHDLPQKVRAVLRLRQEAAKASAAKYARIKAMAGADQRLRYIYQYHGAATGRWAGRAVQVHNLVRDTPAPRLVEQVVELVRAGDHETIDAVMGPPMSVLGRCSRAMFVAPPGSRLIAGDFANIEGRGQAWFAGEDWKLAVFRAADAGRGPGVYETAYAKMFGVPVESVKDPSPERQIGKVCLAAGSLVLCQSGWKPIETVTMEDRVWDGQEWASHQGVLDNGLRPIVNLCGLWLTPDHRVWCANGWETAESRVASSESTFRALATATALLSSEAISAACAPAGSPGSSWRAIAAGASMLWHRTIFVSGARLAATIAGVAPARQNVSGGTPPQCQTTNTGDDCSTGSRQQSSGVTIRPQSSTTTTVGAVFEFVRNGARIARCFFDTCKRWTAGTILRWSWTVATRTATMSRATSASLHAPPTPATSAASRTSKPSARVYDLLSVGSKNRFTVWSESGPLLVSNCELAFGYQGGVGAFHVMAQTMGLKMPDSKAEELKQAWRAAHPRIVAVWYDIERAARAALLQPGVAFSCGAAGRQATYKKVGSFLWCRLPSGRVICYPYPKLLADEDGGQITYMTTPSPSSRRAEKTIDDPKNSNVFARVVTYGGALFNNIVQGFCRDVLADLLLRLDQQGAKIVLHTHDEAVIEVEESKAERACEAMQRMMRTPPEWAPDLPVFAKCAVKIRYGK